jgi:hypothetical protein
MLQHPRAHCLRLCIWSVIPPAAALLAGCGTEPPPPGTLTLLLDSVPPAVAATTLSLTGTVTRTPVLAVPIILRAEGGVQVIEAVAASNGAFTLNMALTPNALSSITVTAHDSTGSTSQATTVQVLQDSRGPTVLSVSPVDGASDVSPNQAIVITFDQAIDPSYVSQVSVRRGGRPLRSAVAVTPDSLSMTITPGMAAPGALYQVTVNGVRDALGNVQTALKTACYTTALPAGATPIVDPEGDIYYAGQVTAITPSDFLGASFSVTGSLLDVLLSFTTARAVRSSGSNALFAVLDLDYDMQQATGWRPLKDIVFEGVLPASGAGVEHSIAVAAWPDLGDSSFFGHYTAEGTVQVDGTFLTVGCGTRLGFTLDNGLLGAPATFDLVGYFETSDANGAFADAAPDSGVYHVALPTSGAPGGVAPVTGPRRPVRIVHLPSRRFLR